MDPTINALVNDALAHWVEITGWKGGGKIRLGDFWLVSLLEELNASRDLDPTGITTFMMLRGAAEVFLEDRAVSALEILTDPEGVERQLVPLRALRAILEDPQVVKLVAGFQGLLREAADHYGLCEKSRKELEKLLSDKFDLAMVRRDAMRSMETLEAHQFLQGEIDPEGLRLDADVYEFWNMNSLIAAMRTQRTSGITVCMLRDPEAELYSCFVLAVKNGLTLTVLTDRTPVPHPDFKQMARRPDRTLVERASQHWFPYFLLDVRVTADQRALYIEKSTALVAMNTIAVKRMPVRDLPAPYFVWLVLVADLIRQRYEVENHRLPETSYTAAMIVEPEGLVSRESALVRSGAYEPLELAPIRAGDLAPEKLAPQWEDAPAGFNHWMVERYGAEVPEAVLNPVGRAALPGALSSVSGLLQLPAGVRDDSLYGFSRDMPAPGTALTWQSNRGFVRREELHVMDPTAFGTAADLQRDRAWTARRNQIKVVQALAYREFEATRDAVIAWYRDAVLRNQERIFRAVAEGSWDLPTFVARREDIFDKEFRVERTDRIVQCLGRGPVRSGGDLWSRAVSRGDGYLSLETGSMAFQRKSEDQRRILCHDDPETRASVFTVVQPNCPEALAEVCGVDVEDLPWQLQHWSPDTGEVYKGNSILDRLDPEDHEIENPWHRLVLAIHVALSRRAFDRRRKALGLPRKVWPGAKGE
jgi:hypothetical protein